MAHQNSYLLPHFNAADKYKLKEKIASGAFGDVYLGYNKEAQVNVAIKLELISKARHLLHERNIYKVLKDGLGIPRVRWSGQEKGYNVLVMDILGSSLESLFNEFSRRFSLKTILMLADQMISRVEYVHGKNIIHRDIKPPNFLMGTGEHFNTLYLVDFGLAEIHSDKETHQHTSCNQKARAVGTASYASRNVHSGLEQSFRDDMESLGYSLMYFMRGSLPWQGINATNKEELYRIIKEKKVAISMEDLCKGFPNEFLEYFRHCENLSFGEKPNYQYLRQLFRDLFQKKGYNYDNVYDWSRQTKAWGAEGKRC